MGFKPPEKTEDWAVVDRWTNKMPIAWLDWTKDARFFYKIRQYMNLLPMEDLKIPWIKDIPRRRLEEKDFSHFIELAFLTFLQRRFANRQSLFRKLISKTFPYIKN